MQLESWSEVAVYGLAWYAIFLLSVVCHEAAHALAARLLGDPTAARAGQLTLEPWPHIQREPWGTVVVPWLSFLLSHSWMLGWASAPYDSDWATRFPRRAGIMALAGPLANLLFLFGIACVIRAGLYWGWFFVPEALHFSRLLVGPEGANAFTLLLSIGYSLNWILLLFNLLPLPPMDGSAALTLLLPRSWAQRWILLLRESWMGWVGLLFAWYAFSGAMASLHAAGLRLLYPELDLLLE